MLYTEVVELFEGLSSTAKRLEKRDIIAKALEKAGEKDLPLLCLALTGRVFPPGDEREVGIAGQLMVRTIASAYGIEEAKVIEKFKELGDLGLAAEFFSSNRKQRTFFSRDLTLAKVYDNVRKLPEMEGQRSQERKMDLVKELLTGSGPKEARYMVRMILGVMRVGVAEGTLRDAIATAFTVPVEEVEGAYDIHTDYGKVAAIAKGEGREGLLKAEVRAGSPVRAMLGEKAPGLREAMEAYENPAIEKKYDGFRVQIHRKGDGIWVFSRRLEDVTRQFPEVVARAKEGLRAREYIVEGEVLAVDSQWKPRPFQDLGQRIQRKYDIEKMVKKVPVQVNLFDVIFLDGKSVMKEPLRKRWKLLKNIVKEDRGFRLAEHIETKDMKEAERFYRAALEEGQEGVMVKNLDAAYQPGRRVGYWLKVKEILEPLDLVIVKGRWGEGKRAKWISSLVLACRDDEGKLLETGMMGTGLTEEQLEELTRQMKGLIEKEEGVWLIIKPKIVVEIGYEEIQKSPHYPTGFALRFPRLMRFRQDKGVDDIDSVKRIMALFKQQKGKAGEEEGEI